MINISSTLSCLELEKKKDFHRIERFYGSFRVPDEINEDEIKGAYKDGVLELALPVKEPEKRKAIKIEIA